MKLTHGRVAIMQILAIALIGGLILSALGGCGQLPPQPSLEQQKLDAAKIVEALSGAKATVAEMKAEAARVQEQARAATQPVVVKPATDTQPATTLAAPQPVVDAAKKIDDAAGKFSDAMGNLDKYLAAADRVAVEAAKPEATVATVGKVAIAEAAPFLPPPYNAYLAFGVIGLSLVDNILQRIKAAKTKAAAQANVDAINLAIANKQITVSPAATQAVDAIVKDHPLGNQLVDVVAAGAAK